MKSIKLASGFAVSALALAIAGQATAQQTVSTSFSGDLKVSTIIDLENSQYYNFQPGLRTGNEDWYNFVARWTVSNGPFSGRLRVGINEDNKTGNDGRSHSAQVTVDNLLVTEGPIQFGQVGRLTDTAGLYEGLVEESELGDEDEKTRFGVDLGLRYTVSDLNLRLQLEAPRNREGVFGVAGALYQDLDVAKFWVDGQYRITTEGAGGNPESGDPDANPAIPSKPGNLDALGDGMADEGTFNVGVALQATPVDQVTLTGVYRFVDDGDERSVYALKLDVQATDEVSLYALILDKDVSESDNTILRGGVVASLAPFVVELGYESLASDLDKGLIFTKATWTDGPLSAFVGFDYSLDGFDGATDGGFELSFGGDFTSASGIVYGAEYTFSEANNYFEDVSEIELFASYSF